MKCICQRTASAGVIMEQQFLPINQGSAVYKELADSAEGCKDKIAKSNSHWSQSSPEGNSHAIRIMLTKIKGKSMCDRWWKGRAEMAASYITNNSVRYQITEIVPLIC